MAKRKEDLLTRLLAGLSVRGILLHPATLFVLASSFTIGVAVHLWNGHQEAIVNREDYRLTVDKIQLNDPPPWSDGDLKKLVLDHVASDHTASLLDTTLVARTVETFKNVGWVEQVRKVEKSKSGLSIELVYRGPIGMVELNKLTIPDWPADEDGQLLPVDRQAIILPAKLVAAESLLRFSVFDPIRFTKLETWTEWPDERIKGCAEISEVLGSRWQELGLYRIVTFRRPDRQIDPDSPFELWPANGTQVIWGNPPGQETPQEASANKKLVALQEFVAKYGPLNTLPQGKIDVRSGKAIGSNVQTAELESYDWNRK